MITNVSVRPYRQTGSVVRKSSRVRRSTPLLGQLRQLRGPIFFLLLAVIIPLGSASQLLSWQIQQKSMVLEQEKQALQTLQAENMGLLAQRAQLRSASHIQAVAGVRLDLYAPERGQVHKM